MVSGLQMLVCLSFVTCLAWIADCKMHHPMWPGRMSYGNRIFERGPDGKFRLASDRTDSLDSNQEPKKEEEKKITDSAVSFLFALKFYPFRAPILRLVAREIDGVEKNSVDEAESRQFTGDSPIVDVPETKEKKDNLGVLAMGVDFGLPGDAGFGYGEEWPFKRMKRRQSDVDDDDSGFSVDSFDKKRSSS